MNLFDTEIEIRIKDRVLTVQHIKPIMHFLFENKQICN